MQGVRTRTGGWALWAMAALALIWARRLVWQAAVLLFLGLLMALLAMPLMKRLERRLPSGMAAGMSMACLGGTLAGTLMLLIPALAQQGRQMAALAPGMLAYLQDASGRAGEWLRGNGVPVSGDVTEALLVKGQEALEKAAPAAVSWVGQTAGSIGQWMLGSVFAFYFLRDRRRIAQRLILLVPVEHRGLVTRALREMRRETAGYLRGQLMISGIVGGLTAAGLLCCGIPSWLMLGLLMGVLELIPYAGPFLGGVLVALFALPEGASRLLWALGVVIAVQQAEGSVLSPQLLSDVTRLHPIAVVLCITLGGAACGIPGILLSVPLLLCARAVLRVSVSAREERGGSL